MRFRASDIALATGGIVSGPDASLDGVTFDSRELSPGQLFVALIGDRDGHDFADRAAAAGAGALLVSRHIEATVPTVLVDDTLAALGGLARHLRRERLGSTAVVGITGSVGKTSTKDLVVGALGARRRVVASPRSFNNEQGLPWSIVNAPDDAEVLVLEMGMRGPGQIAELCRIATPTIGVVTCVGEAHTELLGGLDGVARAKGELVEALAPTGTAVLNGDDPRVVAMRDRTAARVLTYGTGGDVRLRRIDLDDRSRASVVVDTPWGPLATRLEIPGRHMAQNALAAIAVAGVIHGDLDGVADGLADVTGSEHRMRIVTTADGMTVIDDCYNANPTSMEAAIVALSTMRASRRIAVLGPMAEVADSAARHREIADRLSGAGITLLAVGTDRYGVEPTTDLIADLTDAIAGATPDGVVVLVKGSRVARLEDVVERIASAHGPLV